MSSWPRFVSCWPGMAPDRSERDVYPYLPDQSSPAWCRKSFPPPHFRVAPASFGIGGRPFGDQRFIRLRLF